MGNINVNFEEMLDQVLDQEVQHIEENPTLTEELNNENVESILQSLGQNSDIAISAIDTMQDEIRKRFNNTDPINQKILLESDLLESSPTIDCSVETYGKLAKVEGNQTIEELKQAYRMELVDRQIVNVNPIYNYKLYEDSNKSQLISIGAVVVNDYVIVEDNDEEVIYWQVKVLADNTDNSALSSLHSNEDVENGVWGDNDTVPSLSVRLQGISEDSRVNKKYFIQTDNVKYLANGTTFELFVEDNDEMVSANMFLEVFENTKLRQNISNIRPPRPRHPESVVYEKVVGIRPSGPVGPRDNTIVAVEGRVYFQGDCTLCVEVVYRWSNGSTTLVSRECNTDPNCFGALA